MTNLFQFLEGNSMGYQVNAFLMPDLMIEWNNRKGYYSIHVDSLKNPVSYDFGNISSEEKNFLLGLLRMSGIIREIERWLPRDMIGKILPTEIVIKGQLGNMSCSVQTHWGEGDMHGYITAISITRVNKAPIVYSLKEYKNVLLDGEVVDSFDYQYNGLYSLNSLIDFLKSYDMQLPGDLIGAFIFYLVECARFDILRDIFILNYVATGQLKIGDKIGVAYASADSAVDKIIGFVPLALTDRSRRFSDEPYRCNTEHLLIMLEILAQKTEDLNLYMVTARNGRTELSADMGMCVFFDSRGKINENISGKIYSEQYLVEELVRE